MMSEMTYEEYLGWYAYFEQRPPGWREDDRTHKLMQVQGLKEPGYKVFPSLVPIQRPEKPEGSFDVAGFKGSSLFQKMQRAKGGEKVF